MILIYTDGGSRENPGKAACAFIVVDDNKIIKKYSEYLGVKTNNEAEYYAVIRALENTKEKDIEIISDSELVIKQLNGQYKITKDHLRILKEQVNELIKDRNVKFTNLKRENKFISNADYLVNKELDKKD